MQFTLDTPEFEFCEFQKRFQNLSCWKQKISYRALSYIIVHLKEEEQENTYIYITKMFQKETTKFRTDKSNGTSTYPFRRISRRNDLSDS